jgi:hypothetical protein
MHIPRQAATAAGFVRFNGLAGVSQPLPRFVTGAAASPAATRRAPFLVAAVDMLAIEDPMTVYGKTACGY